MTGNRTAVILNRKQFKQGSVILLHRPEVFISGPETGQLFYCT
jgi:hypothetical protein